MNFEIQWEDAPGVRDEVLASTWAQLRIEIGDQVVTEAIDLRSSSRRLGTYGSLFPLAEWIVENWWSLLHEPSPVGMHASGRMNETWIGSWLQRHNLLAAREGQALPDLTIIRDGEEVVLRWEEDPIDGSGRRIRFVSRGCQRVSTEQVRESMASLVNSVVERLTDRTVDNEDTTRLRTGWEAIRDSELDEADACRALAILGIDPYDPEDSTDALIELVSRARDTLSGALHDDLLEGSAPHILGDDLGWIAASLDLLAQVSPDNRPSLSSGSMHRGSAHLLGYELAARARREVFGLLPTEPITDLHQLVVDRMGWSRVEGAHTPAGHQTRLVALAGFDQDSRRPLIVFPQARSPVGARFRLARAVFCHLSGSLVPGPRLLSGASTRLQRASRAFAAELLCPSTALRSRVAGPVSEEQVEELADAFSVSPLVVAHQIENHKLGLAQ